MRIQTLDMISLVRRLLSQGVASRVVSGFMTVAMLTVVSKAVSFLKDATIAHHFGTADALDAYMLAFTFLAFAATVLGGGLPEAFLPVYAEVKHRLGPVSANRFGIQASLIQLGTLLAAALLIWVLAPVLIRLTTQGFSDAKQMLATSLMHRLMPFLVLFGLSHQLAIWLRADKQFAISASAPVIVPAGIILSLVISGDKATVDDLVAGTVWGALAHTLVLAAAIRWRMKRRAEQPPRWLNGADPALGGMVRRAAPFLMAGVVFSSAVVIDQAMAAWLESGSVAVLGYTEKICGIILALTAGPACDVLFPYFSEAAARGDWAGLKRQLLQSSGLIVGAALPAMLALLVFAPFVVRILFQRGEFDAQDTERVAHVLRFAALQIPFYILGGLLSRVIVSLQASRFILLLSTLALTLNASLNWLFMRSMGAAGIALSTVCVHLLVSIAASLYVMRVIRQREADTGGGPP